MGMLPSGRTATTRQQVRDLYVTDCDSDRRITRVTHEADVMASWECMMGPMTRDAERKRAARYVSARRAAMNMTQEELATAAGIDSKTVGSIERAGRWPTTKTRSRLEAALGWSAGDLQLVAHGGFPATGPMSDDDPDGLIAAVRAGMPRDELDRRVQEVVDDLPPHAQAIMNEMLGTFDDIQRENARLRDGLVVLPSRREDG